MLRLDINLVFTIVNLLIWYVVIRKFLFQPVNNIISQREAALAERYEKAESLQAEALAEKEKCLKYQAEIEEETAKLMAKAKEDARQEYDRIILDAGKKGREIVESSKKEAAFQKAQIIGKAEQEIKSLILCAAEESVTTGSKNQALYDEFLTKAGEMKHAGN